MMLPECNNVSKAHDLVDIAEDDNAARVICYQCWHQYIVRKDWRGVHEIRQYAKLFKRDILQGNDNLFYKYHPDNLST